MTIEELAKQSHYESNVNNGGYDDVVLSDYEENKPAPTQNPNSNPTSSQPKCSSAEKDKSDLSDPKNLKKSQIENSKNSEPKKVTFEKKKNNCCCLL